MKILVTGSKGFIGSRAIKVFGKENEVKGLDKLDGCDIADFKKITGEFTRFKPDCVIHCAANGDIEFCENNRDEAVRNNIIATKNIASLCAKYDCTMVFCSTDHVYRYTKLPTGLREYNDIKGASFYGFTKAVCEQEIRSLVKKHFIARLCWQYGVFEKGMPQNEARIGLVEVAARALKKNKPVTVGKNSRQHISNVYDTIDVFRHMLDEKLPYGVYNVASENELTLKGLYSYIFKGMGADDKKIKNLIIEQEGKPHILAAEPYYLKISGYKMPTFEEGFARYLKEVHPTAV